MSLIEEMNALLESAGKHEALTQSFKSVLQQASFIADGSGRRSNKYSKENLMKVLQKHYKTIGSIETIKATLIDSKAGMKNFDYVLVVKVWKSGSRSHWSDDTSLYYKGNRIFGSGIKESWKYIFDNDDEFFVYGLEPGDDVDKNAAKVDARRQIKADLEQIKKQYDITYKLMQHKINNKDNSAKQAIDDFNAIGKEVQALYKAYNDINDAFTYYDTSWGGKDQEKKDLIRAIEDNIDYTKGYLNRYREKVNDYIEGMKSMSKGSTWYAGNVEDFLKNSKEYKERIHDYIVRATKYMQDLKKLDSKESLKKEDDATIKAIQQRADKLFKAYKSQGFTLSVEHDYATYVFKSPEGDLGVYFYDDNDKAITLVYLAGKKKDIRYYRTTFNDALKLKDPLNVAKEKGKK